jgi:UDP-N-acetylglucosamine 1-carboxyvinyltransferase
MDSFRIRGGNELHGTIAVCGSKNAATKLIAATLLTREPCELVGLPRIKDVEAMLGILKKMGAYIEREGDTTHITNNTIDPSLLPREEVQQMRSSLALAGPLLARFGSVAMPYPGGDQIGTRSIATHLHAFSDLGYQVREESDGFRIERPSHIAPANTVILDEFSVTATENIIMLAAGTVSEFRIAVAAEEPHVQDLMAFLNKMGAEVEALPRHHIRVKGTTSLKGARYAVRPDYIEAGTLVIAVLAVGGAVTITNFPTEDLELFFHQLKRTGANITIEDTRTVRVETSPDLKLDTIQTMIHPGIPTDLQSPLGVLATQTTGITRLHDPLYEGRLSYLEGLKAMGARVEILNKHEAQIEGPTKLKGAALKGGDIRGCMSMIIAGLVAEGTTTIENAFQVDRGYERIDERLAALGADIERIEQ